FRTQQDINHHTGNKKRETNLLTKNYFKFSSQHARLIQLLYCKPNNSILSDLTNSSIYIYVYSWNI
uniref:Uncharacterized protein n=1 Tax=Ciona intestinalis TaxID=7719 RepID=H2Y0E8_CIOIN